jgi:hypothetical protein
VQVSHALLKPIKSYQPISRTTRFRGSGGDKRAPGHLTSLLNFALPRVTAERVETEGQQARLRENWRDCAQGYYVAKRLSTEEAEAMVESCLNEQSRAYPHLLAHKRRFGSLVWKDGFIEHLMITHSRGTSRCRS